MFSYFLSVAIAFIVFGTVFNILSHAKPYAFDSNSLNQWMFVATLSVFWFITIPLLFVAFITYLLKELVDKISQVILKRVKE